MGIKSNIRKVMLLSLGTITAAGLLVLLVAAINNKNQKTCGGVLVSIGTERSSGFLNRQDVLKIMVPEEIPVFKGKPLADINLKDLETRLKRNSWIKEAELYFDNNGMLRVNITEREPLARVFTVGGNSFYLDAAGGSIPLSDRVSVKLPVFTGYPFEKIRRQDSGLLRQITTLSSYIVADSFWMAQVAQVHITPQLGFEIVPIIGSHMVVMGDGNDIAGKLHRLLLFYQQVGVPAGMNKYSIINVAYQQQVVATRRGTASKIDSVQAVRNIKQMIEAARKLRIDSAISTSVDNNIISVGATDTTLSVLKDATTNAVKKDSDKHFSTTIVQSLPTKTKQNTIKPWKKP